MFESAMVALEFLSPTCWTSFSGKLTLKAKLLGSSRAKRLNQSDQEAEPEPESYFSSLSPRLPASWETWDQWEFQDPKLEVPTVCKAYFSGLNFREYHQQNMAWNMVRLRTSICWILKFPLINHYHPFHHNIHILLLTIIWAFPFNPLYSFTPFFSWSLSRAYLGGYGGEVSLDPGSTCPNRLRCHVIPF